MLKEEKHVFTIYSWKREKDHRQVLIDEASAWLDQDASNCIFPCSQLQQIRTGTRNFSGDAKKKRKNFQHNKRSSI